MKYTSLIPLILLLSACGDPPIYPDECHKLFETMKICTVTGMQSAPPQDLDKATKFINKEIKRLQSYLDHYQDNTPRMIAFCTTAERDLKIEMRQKGVHC